MSFYCWCPSNLEFCFLQIVLENAAPIANDMGAADPSSTVVHSLRSKQNSLQFTFQISYVLYGSMRLLIFSPEKVEFLPGVLLI